MILNSHYEEILTLILKPMSEEPVIYLISRRDLVDDDHWLPIYAMKNREKAEAFVRKAWLADPKAGFKIDSIRLI